MHVKIFENTKGVPKKHEAQAIRLSFQTKLIEIANFTIRINQPLWVDSKARWSVARAFPPATS